MREDPTPIATATVPATVAHIAEAITELDTPPIIMGHSFGGTLTQLLLDRGCGAAGVAIDSAPTEGVHVSPLSQIKSLFPALKDPRNRHKAVGFTHDEFHYAFTNTLSEEESRKVYDRYHIPAPGNWIWAYGLIANIKPGHQETWVNYKNPNRAPLLFIGGSEDHIMPPSVNKSNAKHYKGEGTITEYFEFEGRDHWTCGETGGRTSPTTRSIGRWRARRESMWLARRSRRSRRPEAPKRLRPRVPSVRDVRECRRGSMPPIAAVGATGVLCDVALHRRVEGQTRCRDSRHRVWPSTRRFSFFTEDAASPTAAIGGALAHGGPVAGASSVLQAFDYGRDSRARPLRLPVARATAHSSA